jgi:hypothetical protein
MTSRRKFFSNLAASVATLVTAHALPLQKVKRLLEPEFEEREIVIKYNVLTGSDDDLPPLDTILRYKVALMNDGTPPQWEVLKNK